MDFQNQGISCTHVEVLLMNAVVKWDQVNGKAKIMGLSLLWTSIGFSLIYPLVLLKIPDFENSARGSEMPKTYVFDDSLQMSNQVQMSSIKSRI